MKHGHASFPHVLGAALLSCAALILVAAAGCGNGSASVLDAGTDGSPSASDGGAGAACGGGQTCNGNAYCDFPDDQCGTNDVMGTCRPRPEGCPFVFEPVCACDGTTYDNDCEAARQGQDESTQGNCPPPAGAFACGSTFCSVDQTYCERTTSDVIGTADTYTCKPLPAACGSSPTCECLATEPCGDTCAETQDGHVLTCPGG